MDFQKKMDFICVGAQKSGTTALYDYLKKHPKIGMSKQKELHYFDKDHNFVGDINYENYHKFFDDISTDMLWGEVTPIYMYWPSSMQRVWRYNPNVKLIVILRNPIERAFSHWNMERLKQKDSASFSEAIRTERDRCKEALPYKHRVYSYIDRGFYSEQLRRIWSFFPAEQVHVIKHEDLLLSPLLTLNGICDFLGVEPFSEIEENESHALPYDNKMSQDDFLYLKDIFEFEVKSLEKMLNWDCSDWLKQSNSHVIPINDNKSDVFVTTTDFNRDVPVIFILSWNRPIYLWVCLDSIFRHTKQKCKVIIADNSSKDPLVSKVIEGFERRGMFYAVHRCTENDPFRLQKMVEAYWHEIGENFVFIESDIEIMPLSNGECWLAKFLQYMQSDLELGIVGSRVYQPDFVSKEEATTLAPELTTEEIDFLIKSKAPMRRYEDTSTKLINPHNPPLRLLMLRKNVYEQTGFGRDVQIHRKTVSLGYKSRISTEVVHRHLSLLNIYDYMDYSGTHRDEFFDKQL